MINWKKLITKLIYPILERTELPCYAVVLHLIIMLKEMEYNDDLSNSSIRVSLGPDTKKSDIEAFIFSWKQLYSRHIKTGNLHK